MKPKLVQSLRVELTSRGFAPGGESPTGGMALPDSYLSDMDIADLFDLMVARREKISRSVAVVGAAAAKRNYDEVVIVIDAIKSVLRKMDLT